MLGINLSYHLPKEVCYHINKSIDEHAEKSPTMIKRALRNCTEELMSSTKKSSKKMTSYFDDELKKELNSQK
jgi:predicted HicB family RNase H-like nuclease